MICCIYKITSPSGKVYIGQSTHFNKRVRTYKALNCFNQSKLYNSFKKYGFENHVLEILQECEEHELDSLEIYYGQLFNCLDPKTGLNIRFLGYNGKHSEETKKKIGLIHKGKKISEYQKKIISIANKGKIISEETKEKRRKTNAIPEVRKRHSEQQTGKNNAMWGRKHSEETKHKIGERSKLKIYSKEYREKISIGNMGKKFSDETKKKIGDSKLKIILNTNTGVFYFGVIEAANSEGMGYSTLYSKLSGYVKNNTPFIYT